MYKKYGKKVWSLVCVLGLIVVSIFSQSKEVYASGTDRIVQKYAITDLNGAPLIKAIDQYVSFRISAEFKLPDAKLNAGDTTVLQLPEMLAVNTQEIKVKDGDEVIANAYVDFTTKKVTLIYTEQAASKSGITGKFNFIAKLNPEVVKEAKTYEVFIEEEGKPLSAGKITYQLPTKAAPHLAKSGGAGGEKAGYYLIAINRSGRGFKNAEIVDRMTSENIEINPRSLVVEKGTHVWDGNRWKLESPSGGAPENVTKQFQFEVDPDNRGFKVKMGDIDPSEGYYITYGAKITYEPDNGEEFYNDVKLTENNNEIERRTGKFVYNIGSGDASGYTNTVSLLKTDVLGNPLKDAEFKIVRDSTNRTVATVKTDANGKITFSKLLTTDYTVIETVAPEGFTLSTKEYKIKKSDFGENKNVDLGAIENRPIPTNTTIVEGEKTWDDGNNQDGIRPKQITVKLKVDDTVIDSQIVSEASQWKYSFKDLQKLKDGKEIAYTVEEIEVPSYETIISNHDIKNKYTPATTEVSGTKTWDDGNNQDGIRPDEITVNLKVDDAVIDSQVVSEASQWKYSFPDLPVNKEGKAIIYTVEEIEVPGYKAVITDYDIENKHIPATTEISGAKTWDDGDNQDGIRPKEITVNLKVDDKVIDSRVVSEASQWNYSFSGLPVNKEGKAIIYTVEEIEVPGYKTFITGYDIENKYTPATTEVSGTKTWDDGNNQDGIRPDEITVILNADGKEYKRLNATKGDNWEYKFIGLPVNKDGKEITYTVEEIEVPGYKTFITGHDIENKHTPSTTEVIGTKTWDDGNNQDGIRPEQITVILKADGLEKARKDVSATDSWKYSFTELPKLKDGKEITYTVEEIEVPGYKTFITGYDIENKHTPSTTEVIGTKTWDDGNNQDGIRPDEITVILNADGKEYKRLNATKGDNWEYKFIDLPVNKDGKEITYTVEEIEVPGYKAVITGFDIENKHTPSTTEVIGTKTWDDGNNQDGIRPEEITVILKADGLEKARKDISATDSWKYSFTELPKLKDGKEITYSVEEIEVPGYKAVITGFDIENIHIPATTEVSGTKTWDDGNNQDGIRPEQITVILKADGLEKARKDISAIDSWKFSFTELPKLKDGQEIAYSVEEIEVPGYKAVITGFDIENKHTPATTEVSGTKTWDDGNNQDGIRPEEITVILNANGTEVKRLDVTKADSWKFSFKNLPLNKDGVSIKYTVKEVAVPGYEASVTGYNIENTKVPTLPSTGQDDTKLPYLFTVVGFALILLPNRKKKVRTR